MSETEKSLRRFERLRIEKAVYGGAGIARLAANPATAGDSRDEGKPGDQRETRKAVFVNFTLPGELIDARITEDKGSFATAALVDLIEPSADRVPPCCPHYGVCGGCHYQHGSYQAQLEMKTAILRETLERAHLRDLPPIEALGARSAKQTAGQSQTGPWIYRNRIRMHVARTGQDIALGYREAGSHIVTGVVEAGSGCGERLCPIAAPLLLEAAGALVRFAGQSQAAFGLLSECAEVELFCNAEESSLQLSLFLRSGGQAAKNPASGGPFKMLCDALKEYLPQLAGAGLYAVVAASREAPQRASRRSGAGASPVLQQAAAWGTNVLLYYAAGFEYRVSRGSFFQVNRRMVDELVSLVVERRSGALAWDLYAGVGLFSRALTSAFRHVVAVESASPANKDLAVNLAGVGATTVAASTLDFLREQTDKAVSAQRKPARGAKFKLSARQGTRQIPGLVVVDPPRAGLGPDVCALLAEVAAAELVYVSCDPATLSRDLAALVKSGYQLRRLHLADLFPQTFHIETVVLLSRN